MTARNKDGWNKESDNMRHKGGLFIENEGTVSGRNNEKIGLTTPLVICGMPPFEKAKEEGSLHL